MGGGIGINDLPLTKLAAAPLVCPYNDGSSGAPSGSANYPNLLSGYSSGNRPSSLGCSVAGVSYRTGITSGTSLTPVISASLPSGVTISGSLVRCDSTSSPITLNAIDFTGYVLYNASCTGSITVTNNKFACTLAQVSSANSALIQEAGAASTWDIEKNEFYLQNCGTWSNNTSDPISIKANGIVKYNYAEAISERFFSPAAGGTITYSYNLIYNPNTQNGAHENFLQWALTGTTNLSVIGNTVYNALSVFGAEGYQFYSNSGGMTLNSPAIQGNTVIALKFSGSNTMTYLFHGICHTGSGDLCSALSGVAPVMKNNWIDDSGATGTFYPPTGGMWSGWSSDTTNKRLTDGSTVTFPPP